MNFLFLLSIIFLCGVLPSYSEEASTHSFSNIRLPENPAIPGVDFNDEKEYRYPVTVQFAKGSKREGAILLKFNKIVFDISTNGKMQKKAESISKIRSIEFVIWKGRKRNKSRSKSFVFYPSSVKISLLDGSVYNSGNLIRGMSKITFVKDKKKSYLYSYFYDYRKKSRWVNSGKEDEKYPESNPHGDTVVKIIFKMKKVNNFLEKLLQR